jgi:hypothetical protein
LSLPWFLTVPLFNKKLGPNFENKIKKKEQNDSQTDMFPSKVKSLTTNHALLLMLSQNHTL